MSGARQLVTGAARGIGLSIVERFAAEGARVACLDVSAKRPGLTMRGTLERGTGTTK